MSKKIWPAQVTLYGIDGEHVVAALKAHGIEVEDG
jgi:hypothetical protein